jgi:hypothetical protein
MALASSVQAVILSVGIAYQLTEVVHWVGNLATQKTVLEETFASHCVL